MREPRLFSLCIDYTAAAVIISLGWRIMFRPDPVGASHRTTFMLGVAKGVGLTAACLVSSSLFLPSALSETRVAWRFYTQASDEQVDAYSYTWCRIKGFGRGK